MAFNPADQRGRDEQESTPVAPDQNTSLPTTLRTKEVAASGQRRTNHIKINKQTKEVAASKEYSRNKENDTIPEYCSQQRPERPRQVKAEYRNLVTQVSGNPCYLCLTQQEHESTRLKKKDNKGNQRGHRAHDPADQRGRNTEARRPKRSQQVSKIEAPAPPKEGKTKKRVHRRPKRSQQAGVLSNQSPSSPTPQTKGSRR